MSKYSVIFSTFPSKREAFEIANLLLKKKIVACVNIINEVESRYWWKRKIERGREIMVIMKTRKSLVGKIIKIIKQNHSYAVPEIIELPILKGNKDYLKWINESVEN
ncbi:MAG: divalent-cation tolerance protein CutA [Candidatus Micrarchaeia archaeon]